MSELSSETTPRSFLQGDRIAQLREQAKATAENLLNGRITPDQFADFMAEQESLHQKELRKANDRADYDELVPQALSKGGFARRFHETISGQARRSEGSGEPITGSLLFLDLDYFKEVNDKTKNKHATGDEMLRRLGLTIDPNIRPEDLFARIGGEEFALYLPDTDADKAIIVADRLRKAIQEALTPIVKEELGRSQTASIGIIDISSIPEARRMDLIGNIHSIDGAADLLLALKQDADSGMYVAKQSGRNTTAVVSYEGQNRSARVVRTLRSVDNPDQKVIYRSSPILIPD